MLFTRNIGTFDIRLISGLRFEALNNNSVSLENKCVMLRSMEMMGFCKMRTANFQVKT